MSAIDRTNLTLNAKAMSVLYNTLDANESSRIKEYKSTKEILEKLKEFYEGDDDMREQKKSLFVAKCESFKWNLMRECIKYILGLMILL